MTKEPRLRFTDEERADPALEKPIRKADKAAAKADKAQAKIRKEGPAKTVNPETGKVTTKLVLEDKKKAPPNCPIRYGMPPPMLRWGNSTRKSREAEQDNVGVESAHKSEEAAETGARLVPGGLSQSQVEALS